MQRIEEKRIDNSSLVPRRIAEQRTDWRQPKSLGVDLSGLQRGFNALADYVGNEFEKANREMDELAEIKVNSIVKNAELEAKGKFENFSLTQLPNEIPGIRTAFSESVRNQIKDVPMTSQMREKVNAKLSAIDENMKVSMRYELERKRAKYVVDEHIALYNDALQNGNTELALSQRQKLQDLGVSVKQSEADIKSNGAVHALRASFDLNDFENIEKLEAAKDGKYIHFPELRQNERMELIKYGKQRQSALQNENYKKYLVDIVDGNDKYTIAQYKEMFEQGGIDERAYISLVEGKQARNYVSMIDNLVLTSEADFTKVKEAYLNILENEKADNNISEHQYNEVKKALNHKEYTVAKNAIERLQAQRKNEKEQNEYIFKGIKAQIMSMSMPHANDIANVRASYIKEIQKYIKDPFQQQEMIDVLDKELNDDPLEKSENGKLTKAYINEIFSAYAAAGNEDNTMINNWKLDALYVARQMIAKGANFSDVRSKVEEAVKLAAEKDIPRLIHRESRRLVNPATYGKSYSSTNTDTTEEFLDIVGEGTHKWFNIPQKIDNKNVVKSYEGKDYYGNKVTYLDIKMPDGSIKTVIAEDYEEIK